MPRQPYSVAVLSTGGRLHPLPFWKGRGLGSGLRPPSSQEGDRGVEINIEVMAQLTLQIDSPSLLEQLKNVLSLMRGVKIVSDSPVSRSAALEDVPNAETLAAMKEAESGHDAGVVYEIKSYFRRYISNKNV